MFSGMATRIFARTVALCLVGSLLAGCAEFNQRGGVVAHVEDVVLFTAHTKSHRLFRSFMLIGVLTAAARQAGHNEVDRANIEGSLAGALDVAFEAYHCLYENPNDQLIQLEDGKTRNGSWLAAAVAAGRAIGTFDANYYRPSANCQFFDEKMARLDYALYRMALTTLFNEKTSAQLATIRDKLLGEVPVLSPAAKATIFGVKAVNDLTNIVDDLLNLSFSSLGPALILLPLYRDALEMNMWVIADSMTRACSPLAGDAPNMDVASFVNQDGTPKGPLEKCQKRDYALWILNRGNGSIPLWRNFVRNLNYSEPDVEAYAPHFMLVTRFIWRSCSNLTLVENCSSLMLRSYEKAFAQSINVKVGFNTTTFRRSYSASVESPTRIARQPGGATSRNAVTPLTGREGEPTGSISKPPAVTPAP